MFILSYYPRQLSSSPAMFRLETRLKNCESLDQSPPNWPFPFEPTHVRSPGLSYHHPGSNHSLLTQRTKARWHAQAHTSDHSIANHSALNEEISSKVGPDLCCGTNSSPSKHLPHVDQSYESKPSLPSVSPPSDGIRTKTFL